MGGSTSPDPVAVQRPIESGRREGAAVFGVAILREIAGVDTAVEERGPRVADVADDHPADARQADKGVVASRDLADEDAFGHVPPVIAEGLRIVAGTQDGPYAGWTGHCRGLAQARSGTPRVGRPFP